MSPNSIVHGESCLSTAFAVIMNLCKEVMKVTTLILPSSERGYNTIIYSTILVGVLWCCILYHATLFMRLTVLKSVEVVFSVENLRRS